MILAIDVVDFIFDWFLTRGRLTNTIQVRRNPLSKAYREKALIKQAGYCTSLYDDFGH